MSSIKFLCENKILILIKKINVAFSVSLQRDIKVIKRLSLYTIFILYWNTTFEFEQKRE